MKTKEEYIVLLQKHEQQMRAHYGLKSMRIFGSVARGQQHDDSDVDLCVEPDALAMVRLKRQLESLLECPVDLVRLHKHMNPYLLEQIEQHGTYVFN